MSTVAEVTSGNEPADCVIKCMKTGYIITAAYEDFDIVAVSLKSKHQLNFPKAEAEKGRAILSALHTAFDWQVVEA
jgi:hypothetical protein